jgi:hypothetical protein
MGADSVSLPDAILLSQVIEMTSEGCAPTRWGGASTARCLRGVNVTNNEVHHQDPEAVKKKKIGCLVL